MSEAVLIVVLSGAAALCWRCHLAGPASPPCSAGWPR
jgi:hypothetical protein